jgi:TRAP-type uncharacterized transport system fused permease subunit
VEGFLFIRLPWLLRIVFFAAALSLIAPGLNSDLIGFGLTAAGLAGTLILRKKYGGTRDNEPGTM